MKPTFLALSIFILFSTIGYSQNDAEDYLGSWYYISMNHRFSERWSIKPYAEFRFYETSSNYNLTFLSLSANYHLKRSGVLSLGYANLDIDRIFEFDDSPHVVENRIMEQYSFTHGKKKLKINHRLRLEHRFLELSSGLEVQHRLRYRFSLTYPLNPYVSAVMFDEGFVNFQNEAFHENRFFLGFGFNLLPKSQLRVGYLKHHIKDNNLDRIMIGFIYKSSSLKKKP